MIDPRTPVLVGAATITQRVDDPVRGAEALELMRRAVVEAAEDAGSTALLSRIGLVLVPKGIWDYGDPGRRVAQAVGADARTVVGADARTVVGEIGILQQSLISRAVDAVARGQVDVAVVCGAESKHRDRRAAVDGVAVPVTVDVGVPDERLRPTDDILSRAEIERDLAVPAHQYALIESALRHAAGLDDAAQRLRLGRLWASFAAVAATQPDAWDRSAPDADHIVTPSASNRMIATPYTKRLCSQWNVDQAAALVVTSVAEATRLGVTPDRWVFPVAAAESNAMTVLPARAELHRSASVSAVARGVLAQAACTIDDIGPLDLYSCFPAAVQVQAEALVLDVDRADERPLTVTGGMTFAGGPLNSYVLHSTATLARRLRDEPGATGMVTAVSGMLTKIGAGVWASAPPRSPFAAIDVSEVSGPSALPYDPSVVGPGVIVGSTVVHEAGAPARAVAIAEVEGVRTVVVCPDQAVAGAMTWGDWCGHEIEIGAPGRFVPT